MQENEQLVYFQRQLLVAPEMEDEEIPPPKPVCNRWLLLSLVGVIIVAVSMPYANSTAVRLAYYRAGVLAEVCGVHEDPDVECAAREEAFKTSFILFQFGEALSGLVATYMLDALGLKLTGVFALCVYALVLRGVPPSGPLALAIGAVTQGVACPSVAASFFSVPSLFDSSWGSGLVSLLSAAAETSLGVWVAVLQLGQGLPTKSTGDASLTFREFLSHSASLMAFGSFVFACIVAVIIPRRPFVAEETMEIKMPRGGRLPPADDEAPLLGAMEALAFAPLPTLREEGGESVMYEEWRSWSLVLYAIVFGSSIYRISGALNWQYDGAIEAGLSASQVAVLAAAVPVTGFVGSLGVGFLTTRCHPLTATFLVFAGSLMVNAFGVGSGFWCLFASSAFLGLSRSASTAAMYNFVSEELGQEKFAAVTAAFDFTAACAILLRFGGDRIVRKTSVTVEHEIGMVIGMFGLIGFAVLWRWGKKMKS